MDLQQQRHDFRQTLTSHGTHGAQGVVLSQIGDQVQRPFRVGEAGIGQNAPGLRTIEDVLPDSVQFLKSGFAGSGLLGAVVAAGQKSAEVPVDVLAVAGQCLRKSFPIVKPHGCSQAQPFLKGDGQIVPLLIRISLDPVFRAAKKDIGQGQVLSGFVWNISVGYQML
jgi:hypothetical protein